LDSVDGVVYDVLLRTSCFNIHLCIHHSCLKTQHHPSISSYLLIVRLTILQGPITGILGDTYGPRIPILIGSFLHVFGLMMTSISSKYYQFFLAQSVVSAVGCSFLFFPSTYKSKYPLMLPAESPNPIMEIGVGVYQKPKLTPFPPAIAAVSPFFTTHRALALGIMVSGSSVGGVIMPIMVTHLIPTIGFGWAMRTVAFLIIGLLVIGNMCITSRLPPSKKKVNIKAFVVPFKEKSFMLLTASSWFIYLGGFLPFTFIVASARREGMSASLAGYLVAIVNGASYVPPYPLYPSHPHPFVHSFANITIQYIRPHHSRPLR
jgi:MFS family permease